MIYYLLYFFVLFQSFFLRFQPLRLKILTSTTFVLILFSGLRGMDVDRDFRNYYYLWFKSLSDLDNLYFEPFSKLIFSIFYDVNFNFYWVLISFCAISLACKLIVINKLRSDISIFLFVYVGYFYFQHDMTQIRLASALGVYYFSLYWHEKNRLASNLFFFISVLFHASCILLILGRWRVYKYDNLLLTLSIICVMCFFLNFIGLDLSNTVRFIVDKIPYMDKYLFYFSGEWTSQKINVLSFTNVSFIILTIVSVFCIIRYDNDNKLAKNVAFYCLLGLSSIPVLADIPVLAFRVSQVYLVFFPLLCSLTYTIIVSKINLNALQFFLIKSMLKIAFSLYGLVLMYVVIFDAKILNTYELTEMWNR